MQSKAPSSLSDSNAISAATFHSETPPFSSNSSSPTFFHRIFNKIAIPPSVWFIGLAMCFMNMSFVVIYSLAGLYVSSSLGVATLLIAIMDGAVESMSFIMKLFSGIVSDYFRRRKPIMLTGYFLIVIAKIILACSASSALIFSGRFFERFGNGLQATPRDAMVGDVAPAAQRAASFGLMRTLGTAGSCLGGLLGFAAMCWTNNNFQQVFWIAAIPAVIAFIILAIFVQEPKTHVTAEGTVIKVTESRRPIRISDLKLLGPKYWILMIIVGIFMMARFSETMMVLHAHDYFGFDKAYAPLIMSVYNSTYSLSSYPSGIIADRCGRRLVLIIGISALILSDFLLYSATNLTEMFLGIIVWGVQMGAVQNTFLSLITDYVPEDLRGTSFGLYNIIGCIGSICAATASGMINHYYGMQTMFFSSMMVAICALIALLILLPKTKKEVAHS